MREAILKAAEKIERDPASFQFARYDIPKDDGPGAQACALGWIGYYAGKRLGTISAAKRRPYFWDVPERISVMLGETTGDDDAGDMGFYRRLSAVTGSASWAHDASACVRALRAYADKHFPAAEPEMVLAEAA